MNVNDTKKIKLIVFDLDDTLIQGDRADIVFKDTREIMEKLKEHGYKLGIASHNSHANWYLKKNNLDGYFDFVQAFDTNNLSKFQHMTNLMNDLNLKKNECILFDDHLEIVADITGHGIPGFLVDYTTGVTLHNVKFLFERARSNSLKTGKNNLKF